jgi:caffeoyl-CoA O-methyltransferase
MKLLSQEIENYASELSSPESEVLQRLNRDTHAKVLRARMLSGHMQGRLLAFFSRLLKPKRILEIGTYTGYSALCMAEGLDKDGLLHTIDHNAELKDFTAKYIREAGHEHIIRQHIGRALDVLPAIDEIFDLVFIDADKENYIQYFELIFPKLRKGGVVIADNALWSGKVLMPDDEMDAETRGIALFNDYIRNHNGVTNLLLPFRDGLMLVEKL